MILERSMEPSWLSNSYVVGDRPGGSAVLIDAGGPPEPIIAAIDRHRLTVTHVLVTHHHGDHTHGNHLFPGATIVAHERTREEVIAAGAPNWPGVWTPVDWGEIEIAPPFLTFTDAVTLWIDELRCEVRHVGGAAHTTNDSYVWIPEHAVLFAGDLLFHGGTRSS